MFFVWSLTCMFFFVVFFFRFPLLFIVKYKRLICNIRALQCSHSFVNVMHVLGGLPLLSLRGAGVSDFLVKFSHHEAHPGFEGGHRCM